MYLICPFKRGIPQPVFPEIMSGIVCLNVIYSKLTIMLVTCYQLPFKHFHQLLYGSFQTCFLMYLLRKRHVLRFKLSITVESIDRIL